jgi:hypothetical protein
MAEANDKKVVVLLKIYAALANLLIFINPSLLGAVSLRMVDITLKSGSTPECPLAFAFYSGALVSMGNEYVDEACRLGVWGISISINLFVASSNIYDF